MLDIDLGSDFMALTPKAQAATAKTKWGHIKLTSFCTAREMTSEVKSNHGTRENACKPHVWKGASIPHVHLRHLNSKPTTSLAKSGQRT